MIPRSLFCSIVRGRTERIAGAVALLGLALPGALGAQTSTFGAVLPGWIGLIAAPGREQAATNAIMAASPGWTRGALGTLVRRAGSGSPRRVIACALDRPAYSVSEITADGYLRVQDAEPLRSHALWDQFHEGQRVLVQTRDGVRAGVFGVRSTHLWRRRAIPQDVTTTDALWLDVGARSAKEVAALDIRLLDPVVRELPAWTFGGASDPFIAGPGAASRTQCAAVAALAQAAPAHGENVYVIAAQSSFGAAGVTSALARIGMFDELVFASGTAPNDSAAVTELGNVSLWRGTIPSSAKRLRTLGIRTRFTGSLMEAVHSSDANAYLAALAAAADVSADAARFVTLPAPPAAPPTKVLSSRATGEGPALSGGDAWSGVADLLGRLADTYGVSGHEAPVRDAVLRELPDWAKKRATVDSAGNLVVAVGPDRDTAVVVAHMDELGFEVTHIAPDGTVSLATRGGFFNSLWEGQPALLHVGAPPRTGPRNGACTAANEGPLRGLFVPRDSATRRQPASLTAWFGLDSAALVARGVGVGSSITAYKCAARLGSQRFTARSLDDRAGTTAVVLAIRDLDPASLKRKVLFVFSVREETGLSGAAAAAALFGPSVQRVYAVDTFVSSDSPLESSRFAHAPLGAGAVFRALDNSSVTMSSDGVRVESIARARKIPLQIGTTNGGNDGSAFARYGASDIPLSWPGRYSHSPAELLDLSDVRDLADLVHALIIAP
jgi:putative aminopeptidase FrvX